MNSYLTLAWECLIEKLNESVIDTQVVEGKADYQKESVKELLFISFSSLPEELIRSVIDPNITIWHDLCVVDGLVVPLNGNFFTGLKPRSISILGLPNS